MQQLSLGSSLHRSPLCLWACALLFLCACAQEGGPQEEQRAACLPACGAGVPCVEGRCVPEEERRDAPCVPACVPDQVCRGGVCVTPEDPCGACAEDEVCALDGSCVPRPECAQDADCEGGRCVLGQCEPPPGQCDPACEPGQGCVEGACVWPPECLQDSDCPQGLVCVEEACTWFIADTCAQAGELCAGEQADTGELRCVALAEQSPSWSICAPLCGQEQSCGPEEACVARSRAEGPVEVCLGALCDRSQGLGDEDCAPGQICHAKEDDLVHPVGTCTEGCRPFREPNTCLEPGVNNCLPVGDPTTGVCAPSGELGQGEACLTEGSVLGACAPGLGCDPSLLEPGDSSQGLCSPLCPTFSQNVGCAEGELCAVLTPYWGMCEPAPEVPVDPQEPCANPGGWCNDTSRCVVSTDGNICLELCRLGSDQDCSAEARCRPLLQSETLGLCLP